jgi:uncharacterized membrane protein
MEFYLSEWLNLIFRWVHVIAGIMWVGQTYLFNWMERSLDVGPDTPENVQGSLWMVHGGGFYNVEKQKVPKVMPRTLHWFKWESAFTWLSGMALLTIVYYHGGLMLEYESELSSWAGAAIGLAALVVGFVIYNLIWRIAGKNEILGTIISYVATVATAYGLMQVLSTRAAYMHIGALFGTIMVANVWMKIMPAQRQLVAAAEGGTAPDMSLAARAKGCSKHNTYMSVPLILIMTATYGNTHNVAVLAVLIIVGWIAAKFLRDGWNSRAATKASTAATRSVV